MKLLTCLVVILSVALCAHAGITISWTDCGKTMHPPAQGKIVSVKWTPSDPQPGDNVTITAVVNFTSQVTALHSVLEFLDGIIKDPFDGCSWATIDAPLDLAVITFRPPGCPLSPGHATFVRYVSISPLLLDGTTTSILKAHDQNHKPFVCSQLTLTHTS